MGRSLGAGLKGKALKQGQVGQHGQAEIADGGGGDVQVHQAMHIAHVGQAGVCDLLAATQDQLLQHGIHTRRCRLSALGGAHCLANWEHGAGSLMLLIPVPGGVICGWMATPRGGGGAWHSVCDTIYTSAKWLTTKASICIMNLVLITIVYLHCRELSCSRQCRAPPPLPTIRQRFDGTCCNLFPNSRNSQHAP